MIPKQEPTLMDVIANCLMDLEGAFAEAQSSKKSSSSSPQAGFSGWTGGPLFGGQQFPFPGTSKSSSRKNCPYYQSSAGCKQSSAGQTGSTTTASPADHFSASFDVSAFDPSNVSVKVEDAENTLEVHAKEEKTAADGSFESREYRKKVPLPETVLTAQLKCTLDQSGQLKVLAPLKKEEKVEENKERVIPVQFVNSKKTGQEKEEKMEENEKNEDQAKEPEVTIEDVGTD